MIKSQMNNTTVVRNFEKIKDIAPSIITIGKFNGLHIGLSLASADVHFQNICQGLSLV